MVTIYISESCEIMIPIVTREYTGGSTMQGKGSTANVTTLSPYIICYILSIQENIDIMQFPCYVDCTQGTGGCGKEDCHNLNSVGKLSGACWTVARFYQIWATFIKTRVSSPRCKVMLFG